MTAHVLRFENLEAGYDGRVVLRAISGDVPAGARVAVIGPNGCGKSTLVRALMGVVPTWGRVSLSGQDISRLSTIQRSRAGIGCMRQGLVVFPSLTGRENLEMAHTGRPSLFPRRVEEIMTEMPLLRDSLERRAGLLSGGARQALGLAMVLMNRPRLLLLDEPLAGLAARAADEILLALRCFHGAWGLTWLMVEHRLPLLRNEATSVWIMRDGAIVHRTDDVAVLDDPAALATHYQLT